MINNLYWVSSILFQRDLLPIERLIAHPCVLDLFLVHSEPLLGPVHWFDGNKPYIIEHNPS